MGIGDPPPPEGMEWSDACGWVPKSSAPPMTPSAPGTAALREAIRKTVRDCRFEGLQTSKIAEALLAGPLAPILADLAAEKTARVAAEGELTREREQHRIADIMAEVGYGLMVDAADERDALKDRLATLEAENAALVERCGRLEADNERLQRAYGCHVQADAYRDTMPDDEDDAKGLRRSETHWRLMARTVIAEGDDLTEACSRAATQIPEVKADAERAIAAALARGERRDQQA